MVYCAFPQSCVVYGSPPQVYWHASGCTYWVHWHMVEIIGSSGQEEHEGREKVSTLRYSHKLKAGELQPSWACNFFPGLCPEGTVWHNGQIQVLIFGPERLQRRLHSPPAPLLGSAPSTLSVCCFPPVISLSCIGMGSGRSSQAPAVG